MSAGLAASHSALVTEPSPFLSIELNILEARLASDVVPEASVVELEEVELLPSNAEIKLSTSDSNCFNRLVTDELSVLSVLLLPSVLSLACVWGGGGGGAEALLKACENWLSDKVPLPVESSALNKASLWVLERPLLLSAELNSSFVIDPSPLLSIWLNIWSSVELSVLELSEVELLVLDVSLLLEVPCRLNR